MTHPIEEEPNMTSSFKGTTTHELRPGDALEAPLREALLRVRRGVIGVTHRDSLDRGGLHYLVLPGDLVGAELLADEPMPLRVFAVTTTELDTATWSTEPEHRELLAQAYAQSRRQGRELARLRTGSLTDRVRQLLLLLGGAASSTADVELPTLRQLAHIVDASPEAICRVLGSLRHLDVLQARPSRRVRVARRALTELVPLEGMSSGVRAMLARPSANREAAC